MEPGTRAERVLSFKLRQASARAILALAAVATLTLPGCGGSSSEDPVASAPAPQGAGTETGASGPGSKARSPEPGSQAPADQGKPSSQGEQGPQGQGRKSPEVAVPSGEREKGITPQQRAEATTQSMRLGSPALQPATTGGPPMLPAIHTCDGEGTWPELVWQGVPPGTAELVLFAMSLRPVEGQPSYNWTVAGIDPNLTGIPSGRLPRGAVMGRNSFGQAGYTVCPPKGSSETYVFTLYALPERLAMQRGFDPNALRREVGRLSSNGGIMAAGYRRG